MLVTALSPVIGYQNAARIVEAAAAAAPDLRSAARIPAPGVSVAVTPIAKIESHKFVASFIDTSLCFNGRIRGLDYHLVILGWSITISLDVPTGSFSTVRKCLRDVCFLPDRDKIAALRQATLWAKKRHRRR
jgi:hypothetical protein